MRLELFIAKRYLISRRKQTFISVISLVSVLGVAIGVAALVVVMGVYNGFTTDIRDKILGANSHILILSPDQTAFDPQTGTESGQEAIDAILPMIKKIENTPGVRSATPYLLTEVLLSTPRGATGLIIRGVDPAQAIHALNALQDLEEGEVETLEQAEGSSTPGIIVGKQLADRFGINTGSRVNLMSPAGQRTAAGFSPKIKTFKVVGIFQSGMTDYDSRLAYVSLSAIQDLMGLPPGRITGLEIFVNNPYEAKEIGATIEQSLGWPFYASNWMDMNSNLFAALQLERIGMFIVLAMVILVGSFSIITSLVMLVMEKTKDIAILMSMGATSKVIRRIFTWQGLIIGAVGTVSGYIIGVALALALKKYQFIEIPPGVYALDRLPVLINVPDTVLIGVVSMLMCFLATIYPSRQAAKLQPAAALRYE